MKNKAQIKLKWKLEEIFITDITAKIGIHNVSHLQSNIKNVGNTIKKGQRICINTSYTQKEN